MSISHVGAATGTTTATVPAHNVGDLIIIFAYRSGSTTAPSLPAGYVSILTKSGTSCSARIGYKIATATNDASGTWTNATELTCLVYRSSNYATGGSLYVGGSASSSSTTTTVGYPALTMTHADATSWAIGFAGTSVATAALSTHAPTGMTFFTGSDVTATTEVCAFDTNGTVSSWSLVNTTVSASGNSVSATVELIENQPGAAVSNFVQHIATAYNDPNSNGETGDLFVRNFDPTLAGNGLVVAVAYPQGPTVTISDNKSNTWGAAAITASSVGGMALSVFVLASATTGTSQITVSLGGAPKAMVKVWIEQLYNVTGTVEATANAAGVNAAGIVAPGSMTPAVANCLVLSYMVANATTGVGTNPALIVPETGYALNDADISWGTGGLPAASQFALQTTATATNARFYLNGGGGTDTYCVAAVALSTGSQGTPKPSGAGVAPWIDRILYWSMNSAPASLLIQIPASGNAGVLMNNFQTTGTPDWTAVSDNDGTSWTAQTPTAGAPTAYTRVNASARLSRTATITVGNNASQNFFGVYYDLSNCATSPIVASAGVGSTTANNTTSVANQPSITPTGTNQLTLTYMGVGVGPSVNPSAPSGAVDDYMKYQVAQFTGSTNTTPITINGTSEPSTLTVSAVAWGSIGDGNLLTDNSSTLAVGSTIHQGTVGTGTGGTGTYGAQPSQTVASETMFASNSDVNNINWGNAAAHYFNGNSTAAQSWTWNIANQPSNSVLSIALIFAGPAASANAPVGKLYEINYALKRSSTW